MQVSRSRPTATTSASSARSPGFDLDEVADRGGEPVDGHGQAHGPGDRAGHLRPGRRAGPGHERAGDGHEAQDRLDALEGGHQLGVDPAGAGLGDRAGPLDVRVADDADGVGQLGERLGGDLAQVVGVHAHHGGRVGGHQRQRPADRVEHGGVGERELAAEQVLDERQDHPDDRLADLVGHRHGRLVEAGRPRRRARRRPRRPAAPSGPGRRPAARRRRARPRRRRRRLPVMPSAWPAAKPSAWACWRSRSSSSA